MAGDATLNDTSLTIAGTASSINLNSGAFQAKGSGQVTGSTILLKGGKIASWEFNEDEIVSRTTTGTTGVTLRMRQAASVFGTNNYQDTQTRLQGFGIQWYQRSNAGYMNFGELAVDSSGNPVTNPSTSAETGWHGLSMCRWDSTTPYFQFAVRDDVSGILVNNQIAGWKFNTGSLWTGTEQTDNTAYSTDGITIGSAGYISAEKFRLQTNGDVYLEGDVKASLDATNYIHLDPTKGELKMIRAGNERIKLGEDINIGVPGGFADGALFTNSQIKFTTNVNVSDEHNDVAMINMFGAGKSDFMYITGSAGGYPQSVGLKALTSASNEAAGGFMGYNWDTGGGGLFPDDPKSVIN